MDAFDGPGMLLTGVLVRCMEKEGIALGRETSADQILENLSKRYQRIKTRETSTPASGRCRQPLKKHWRCSIQKT